MKKLLLSTCAFMAAFAGPDSFENVSSEIISSKESLFEQQLENQKNLDMKEISSSQCLESSRGKFFVSIEPNVVSPYLPSINIPFGYKTPILPTSDTYGKCFKYTISPGAGTVIMATWLHVELSAQANYHRKLGSNLIYSGMYYGYGGSLLHVYELFLLAPTNLGRSNLTPAGGIKGFLTAGYEFEVNQNTPSPFIEAKLGAVYGLYPIPFPHPLPFISLQAGITF